MALENDIQAPDFDLPNQFGEHVRLADYRGVRPVALVFFPLAFSSTCTAELCTLRDNLSMFQDARVELIGISVDSKATLRAFAQEEGYDFTLLADFWPHGEVSKEYGVFLEHKPGQARSLADYQAALEQLVSVPA
jgi:peroxiredoxin